MDPRIVRAGDARLIALYDVTFRYGITAAESNGGISMFEVTVPPRTLVKPHMHTRGDEYSLILSGTVSAALGDETAESIPAGSWLVKPRQVRHAMWNATDEPVRILEVVLPGGLDAISS